MNHASDEQLLDRFYGEADICLGTHIERCPDCRARLRQLQEALACLGEYPVPERDEAYGREVWTRIEPQLPSPKRLLLQPPWFKSWILAAMLAGLLIAVFFGGFYTGHIPAHRPGKAQEKILLNAISNHLERSQMVLAELVNANPGSLDWRSEQERARNLLTENRLLRVSALRLGDRPQAAVLEDLERVLMEVANGPSETSSADLTILQQQVEKEGLLWKVRIVSSGARERGQKS